jgi:hypothetical protein
MRWHETRSCAGEQSIVSALATCRTLASPLFHKAIHARTKDVHPAKVYAYRHTALCVLPAWLASLFARHPQLESRAVEALSSAEKKHMRKVCSGDLAGQLQKVHGSTEVTGVDLWIAASPTTRQTSCRIRCLDRRVPHTPTCVNPDSGCAATSSIPRPPCRVARGAMW